MPTFTAPTPHSAMPNIGNYRVGRGFLEVQLEGDTVFSDSGNVTQFEFQAKPTMLDHFSSRIGVRKKDLVAVTELSATLTMVLEEVTARNLAMCLLGSVSALSPPNAMTIDIMSRPAIYASLLFIDTSTVGPKWNATFPLVLLTPQRVFSLISQGSGAWSSIELQGDVLFDKTSGQFGWFTSTNITSP